MAKPEEEPDLHLLRWHVASGVDSAVQESPRNWLDDSRPAASQPLPPKENEVAGLPSEQQLSPVERDMAAQSEAEALAAASANLDQLRNALNEFDGCALKMRATQLVFADGNPEADVMLVGEAPGRDEDLQGKPFVGRSGQLLDRMLATIGLDRTKVYIANTVPWRPPGNRTPTPAEIATCAPFLHRQIELVAPRIIVSLGAPATQTLRKQPKLSIMRERGKFAQIEIGGHTCETLAMFHPAFLLRQPLQKRDAWADLLTLHKRLQSL